MRAVNDLGEYVTGAPREDLAAARPGADRQGRGAVPFARLEEGRRRAKEAMVSRAMRRIRVWHVTALLAGVLTHLLGGPAPAQTTKAPTDWPGFISTKPAPAKDARTLARSKLLQ